MLVAFLVALLTGVAPAAPPQPCATALKRGPEVPAALIFRTSCGGYRLAVDGRVTKLPRGWLARHGGGTGRRFGADVTGRRTASGRFYLDRGSRLLWRSSGLYRNDGGSIAFGPRSFAFASYRRGILMTDLKSPEQLVVRGRGASPVDFTRSGRLIVSRQATISVVSPEGIVERRYRFRRSTGFAFDAANETLLFVTPGGRLASAAGTSLRLGRNIGRLAGTLGLAKPDRLIFGAAAGFTVTRRDGTFVADGRWRRGLNQDSGVSVSPDGLSFAYRLLNVYPGARSGEATFYVLRAGQRQAHAVYRHRLGPTGCALGGNLRWHGTALLYDSVDSEIVLIDRRNGPRSLKWFARELPHRLPGERTYAAWASDYR